MTKLFKIGYLKYKDKKPKQYYEGYFVKWTNVELKTIYPDGQVNIAKEEYAVIMDANSGLLKKVHVDDIRIDKTDFNLINNFKK